MLDTTKPLKQIFIDGIEKPVYQGPGKLPLVVGGESVDNFYDIEFEDLDGITEINQYAFYYCMGLRAIKIPPTVTKIGVNAFQSCSNINAVFIKDLGIWCNTEMSGSSANPLSQGSLNRLYLNGSLVETAIIPDTVGRIRQFIFSMCKSIKSVIIPNSVTIIETYAFRGCGYLQTVNIGSGITNIAAYGLYCGASQRKVTITINATTPPTITATTLPTTNSTNKIIVPAGTLATYQAATNWSTYATYMEEAAA